MCLDQTALPQEMSFLFTTEWEQAREWICRLVVRGAPAIGAAGAAALALAAWRLTSDGAQGMSFFSSLERISEEISSARPTAVNLAQAVGCVMDQVRRMRDADASPHDMASAAFDEALKVQAEDEAANREMGRIGAGLLPHGCRVLTHCNAGSLATSFYGTALGVIYAAAEEGKIERVFADETRPVCQGSRLTVWELAQAGVPVTLICDDMAASVMSQGMVDAVIVGADRIAANGDAANKIGTLGVAIIAKRFNIPFYVAAPTSTIDLGTETGADIPIEIRADEEVLPCGIEGVDVYNPAFDVTPAELITAIITEVGAFAPGDMRANLS
ncbi:MAG: S-methyl-5-thioribose-1-phosphate isomerase [Eggerthellaceae bacterium]|nr:S-methyl-5-thioribose-1-phosphate isomerase [Eggerthellaceae bacterium]